MTVPRSRRARAAALVALLLGVLQLAGCGDREHRAEPGSRSFEFTGVELRSEEPGLRLVSVSGAVHESVCDWSVSLRNAGGDRCAATVAVTVAFRSAGEQRFLRLSSSLDLAPDEGVRLHGLSRPGRTVDSVDWVDVRRIGDAQIAVGTPPPLG